MVRQSSPQVEYTKGEWRRTIIGMESKVVDDKVDVIAHLECRNTLEEIEANAHLIASAPDMYEALKDLAACFRNIDFRVVDTEDQQWVKIAIDSMNKALAKARGE